MVTGLVFLTFSIDKTQDCSRQVLDEVIHPCSTAGTLVAAVMVMASVGS